MAIRKIWNEYLIQFYGLEQPTSDDRLFPHLINWKKREVYLGGTRYPAKRVEHAEDYCLKWAELNSHWIVTRWTIKDLGVYKGKLGKEGHS